MLEDELFLLLYIYRTYYHFISYCRGLRPVSLAKSKDMINPKNVRELHQREVTSLHYSNGITLKLERLIFPHVSKPSQGILVSISSHDDVATTKENVGTKVSITLKATTITKVVLETIVHATRVVAFV
jgi:hypothetical protein